MGMTGRDAIVDRVIELAGGERELARLLGIKVPSIYSWRQVPPRRALDIEKITGIPRHRLRPDLWEPPAASADGSEAA